MSTPIELPYIVQIVSIPCITGYMEFWVQTVCEAIFSITTSPADLKQPSLWLNRPLEGAVITRTCSVCHQKGQALSTRLCSHSCSEYSSPRRQPSRVTSSSDRKALPSQTDPKGW